MLPVSGAAQLVACGAIQIERPIISAMTAYYSDMKETPLTLVLRRYEKVGPHLQISQVSSDVRIMRLAQKQIPKTEFLGFKFEFLHYGNDGLPALDGVGGDLSVIDFFGRNAFVLRSVDGNGAS
jgi:hypothetical protein